MVNVVPWDLPRHSIHHDTSLAFSNNVPVCTLRSTLYTKQMFTVHSTLHTVQCK